jgi:thioesterase domain-containing protein
LQYAGNGGEVSDIETIERFTKAAAPHGFVAETCSPGYGLAEAVCTVSASIPRSGVLIDRVDRNALSMGEATPAAQAAPGTATFLSVGRALEGTDLAIFNEHGDPLPDRGVGEIVLTSDRVMRGYLDDPEATAAAFSDGWLRTGDVGYMVDGELFITGRLKDVIIIGGQNYHAEDIELVVQTVAGVRRGGCVVVPVRNAGTEGLAVLAEASPQADASALRSAIARRVAEETGIGPRTVVVLDPRSLPKTTSGKLRRAEARSMLEKGELSDRAGGAQAEVAREPQGYERILVAIWEEILDIHPVGLDDDFFHLGGTSLQAAAIVSEIEWRLGRVLPLAALIDAPTIARLTKAVHASTDVPTDRSTVALSRRGSRTIFAVPGGGGAVIGLRNLAHHTEGFSFYGFQAQGADARGRPDASVEEMAARYILEMSEIEDGPYMLLGYSFGGIVAYEMAVQLTAAGRDVALLVLVDTSAPRAVLPVKVDRLKHATLAGVRNLIRFAWKRRVRRVVGWSHLFLRRPLSGSRFSRYMLGHAHSLWSKYQPAPYPGRIEYFRVLSDQDDLPIDRLAGWDQLADDVRVHDVHAPVHEEVLAEPWVKSLATELNRLLSTLELGDSAPVDEVAR